MRKKSLISNTDFSILKNDYLEICLLEFNLEKPMGPPQYLRGGLCVGCVGGGGGGML